MDRLDSVEDALNNMQYLPRHAWETQMILSFRHMDQSGRFLEQAKILEAKLPELFRFRNPALRDYLIRVLHQPTGTVYFPPPKSIDDFIM